MMPNSRDASENMKLKELSSQIQSLPLAKCLKQHELREIFKHYLLYETRNNDSLIIKQVYLVCQHDFSRSPIISSNDPIPRCTRTRKVEMQFTNHNNKTYFVATCDCGYVHREKHTCRHIQHIVNMPPAIEFFHPQCYKSYFHFMFVCDDCTKLVQDHDNLVKNCKGIMIDLNFFKG